MDPDYEHLTVSAHLAQYEAENQHAELQLSAPAASRGLFSPSGPRPAADPLIIGYTDERRTDGTREVPGDGEIPDQR